MLTRRILVTCRRCFPMLYKPFRKFAVTHFVEHVERIDQQAFMVGRWIGDRVDVGGISDIISAFKTQRRVDANGARIEDRS